VPIYVGRSLGNLKGTYIKERDEKMEDRVITGLSINENTLMAGIRNIPNKPQNIALIFDELGKQQVNVDMISQSLLGKEILDLSFTCPKTEEDLFDNAIEAIKKSLPEVEINKRNNLIKIGLVGIGMMSHSGVAGTIFSIFAKENIKFYQVTTSEISISYTIDKENKDKAVNAIAKEFNL
jgi:aspartate kinase